jgi:hypothetical protein
MNTKKFQTADSLVEYCINNNMLAGQVWVDSNPFGDGKRTLLWFCIDTDKELSTYLGMQHKIKSVDYAYLGIRWYNEYKGSFELVIPFDQFTKPEVYAVGDTVEVLENVREIGNWENLSPEKRSSMIGKCYKIVTVYDDFEGIYYTLNNRNRFVFPHYCIKKVEQPPKEMTQAQIEQELGYKINIIE